LPGISVYLITTVLAKRASIAKNLNQGCWQCGLARVFTLSAG